MTRCVTGLAVLIAAVVVAGVTADCPAAADSALVTLASAKFPQLTRAERAMLDYADVNNVGRSEIAVAGSSANPSDPSNDPARVNKWDEQRNVRAALIRWMAVDPAVNRIIDPVGIRVLGARIIGRLDLAHVHVSVPLVLRNCSIPEEISFDSAELPYLSLSGSHTAAVYAPGITVTGTLEMRSGFDASAQVYMEGARIGGDARFDNGHFRYSLPLREFSSDDAALNAVLRPALSAGHAQIKGSVFTSNGFVSEGATVFSNTSIAGDLICWGGHFINPNNFALFAPESVVSGDVHLNSLIFLPPPAKVAVIEGLVDFTFAAIGGALDVAGVRFLGATDESHGLWVRGTKVNFLLTKGASFPHEASLDLSGAQIEFIADDIASWPTPGKLNIGQAKYQAFSADSPIDVGSRLRWLRLNVSRLYPQPYDQLAKYYFSTGDSNSATRVLIARDDAIYGESDWLNRVWGIILKITVGYGHRPMLAVSWSLIFVIVGWIITRIAYAAGVMRRTYPENSPTYVSQDNYERLYPLLFSLDVFLPFVNLHQEHYWWPNAAWAGETSLAGRRLRVSGRWVLYYLWMQIIAGWLLSAIFVAGVTGLIRND